MLSLSSLSRSCSRALVARRLIPVPLHAHVHVAPVAVGAPSSFSTSTTTTTAALAGKKKNILKRMYDEHSIPQQQDRINTAERLFRFAQMRADDP